MAIGIVSVASLLPMGGLQAQKANVEERKSELVLNAVRDFHIRGMANPQTWIRPQPSGASYLPLKFNRNSTKTCSTCPPWRSIRLWSGPPAQIPAPSPGFR